jgi:hypothetical protein
MQAFLSMNCFENYKWVSFESNSLADPMWLKTISQHIKTQYFIDLSTIRMSFFGQNGFEHIHLHARNWFQNVAGWKNFRILRFTSLLWHVLEILLWLLASFCCAFTLSFGDVGLGQPWSWFDVVLLLVIRFLLI